MHVHGTLWLRFPVPLLPPPSWREATWSDILIGGWGGGGRGGQTAVTGLVTCSGAFVLGGCTNHRSSVTWWKSCCSSQRGDWGPAPHHVLLCDHDLVGLVCFVLFSRNTAHYWRQTESAPGCFSSAVPAHMLIRHPQRGRRKHLQQRSKMIAAEIRSDCASEGMQKVDIAPCRCCSALSDVFDRRVMWRGCFPSAAVLLDSNRYLPPTHLLT